MPMQYALSLSRMPNEWWWCAMRDMPVMYDFKRPCMIEKNGDCLYTLTGSQPLSSFPPPVNITTSGYQQV